jgi:uncharacterized protein with HEPN domain
MLSDDDRIRLSHMRDAAKEALSFIAGKSRIDLSIDRQLTLALVKSLEIIGEAGTRVTDDWKQASSDIPWRDIVAMRNRLIHAYFDIDLDVLWETVNNELAPLLQALEESLQSRTK